MAGKPTKTHNRDKEFLFSQKKLHTWFAVSSLLLLVSCVAMVWQDFDRPWKDYQRGAKEKQLELARVRLDEARRNLANDEVNARLTVAREWLRFEGAVITPGAYEQLLDKREDVAMALNEAEQAGADEKTLAPLRDDLRRVDDGLYRHMRYAMSKQMVAQRKAALEGLIADQEKRIADASVFNARGSLPTNFDSVGVAGLVQAGGA